MLKLAKIIQIFEITVHIVLQQSLWLFLLPAYQIMKADIKLEE